MEEQQIAAEITAEPELHEAADVSGEESEAEPTEETAEESEETPKKKPTAQERIQELANARREEAERANRIEAELKAVQERAERLEREFEAKQAAKAPDYIEVDDAVLAQVNARLGQLAEAKQNAELNGNYLQGIAAQKEIDAIYQGLEANAARMAKAKEIAAEQGKQQQIIAALDERAEFYRQANNIPQDVWQESGQWFATQCETDKVLGAQFLEIATYNGPMAAVRWAAEYAATNMPKKAQEVKETKEAAKAALPGGTGKPSPQSVNDLTDDLPYEEWRKRREAQLKR